MLFGLIILLLFESYAGFYLPGNYREKRAQRIEQAKVYFKKYGYFDNLPLCSSSSTPEGRHSACTKPDEIVKSDDDALKRFQREEGLDPTGYVDDATIETMEQPRCGSSDLQSLVTEKFVPWKNETLTYAFINFSNKTKDAEMKSTIQTAFGFWTPMIPRTFVEINDTENADFKIMFARLNHHDEIIFDGPGGTLGHGDISGRVHFDEDEAWREDYKYWDKPIYEQKDLLWAAVHEIGHALGLEHSNDFGSIMRRIYINPKTSKNLYNVPTFVPADIENIQAIYGEI